MLGDIDGIFGRIECDFHDDNCTYKNNLAQVISVCPFDNPAARDYSSPASEKNEVGFCSLGWSGDEPQALRLAAFLLPECAHSLWADWAGSRKARWCSTGLQTRSVPPTRFAAGRRFVKRTGAHIMTALSQKPSVKLVDGKPTTTSQQVAKFFRKEHYRVLRAIKNLDCSAEFRAANFGVTLITVEMPNGATRQDTSCLITKNGFMFLAMGFTGEEAAKWKEAYIAEFDRMDQIVHAKLEAKAALKALPASEPKRYNYSRHLLEQPYFKSTNGSARLSISMLANTEKFISPLFCLLNELQTEGHDIAAAWDEAIAMREAIVRADETLKEIYLLALREGHRPSKVALRDKR